MCASVQCLRARSAAEVVEMFLTSDRVCEDDIPLALEHAHAWSQHIVLREWVDVPPQFEFRGFVYGDRLTALSQYFNNGFFPEVVEQRDLVLQRHTARTGPMQRMREKAMRRAARAPSTAAPP
jgi:hypothetical protein